MKCTSVKLCAVLALVVVGVSFEAARADFVLVEDFEGLALGPIDDQGGWVAENDTSVVTLDPADETNQVLAVTTDSTHLYRSALILNGTVRMMFVRFRFAEQQNYSFGMSDSVAPDQFGHFEVELSMTNATNELRVNDGGTYDELGLFTPGTWYNVWILVNNITDETQLFLHDRPGGDATMDDQLDVDGQTVFDFRNGSAGNLVNFFIKTGGGSGPSGPLYIDDIYIENTDALNLHNPAGEPGCPADANGDGVTDQADLGILLSAFGASEGDPDYNPNVDYDGDGTVGQADLGFLLADFGCGT
ncbi:MAG TPA: hypothetical protein VM487_15365 [Phycisphaerae bacterium]|nr:hypothetical protein [Phycisphaerae bacterium]